MQNPTTNQIPVRSVSDASFTQKSFQDKFSNVLFASKYHTDLPNTKHCMPRLDSIDNSRCKFSTNSIHLSSRKNDDDRSNPDFPGVVSPISPIPRGIMEEKILVGNTNNEKVANRMRREANLSEQKAYQAEKIAFTADHSDGFYSRNIENRDFPPNTNL